MINVVVVIVVRVRLCLNFWEMIIWCMMINLGIGNLIGDGGGGLVELVVYVILSWVVWGCFDLDFVGVGCI